VLPLLEAEAKKRQATSAPGVYGGKPVVQIIAQPVNDQGKARDQAAETFHTNRQEAQPRKVISYAGWYPVPARLSPQDKTPAPHPSPAILDSLRLCATQPHPHAYAEVHCSGACLGFPGWGGSASAIKAAQTKKVSRSPPLNISKQSLDVNPPEGRNPKNHREH